MDSSQLSGEGSMPLLALKSCPTRCGGRAGDSGDRYRSQLGDPGLIGRQRRPRTDASSRSSCSRRSQFPERLWRSLARLSPPGTAVHGEWRRG